MSRSDCQEFREGVILLPDGSLPEAEAVVVREHLRSCAACRALLQEIEELRGQMQALPSAGAPRGFAERVMERWPGAPARRTRRWGPSLGLMAAAALVFVMFQMSSSDQEGPQDRVEVAKAPETRLAADDADGFVRETTAEPGRATPNREDSLGKEGARARIAPAEEAQDLVAVEDQEALEEETDDPERRAGKGGGRKSGVARAPSGPESAGQVAQQVIRSEATGADLVLSRLLAVEKELAAARSLDELSGLVRRNMQAVEGSLTASQVASQDRKGDPLDQEVDRTREARRQVEFQDQRTPEPQDKNSDFARSGAAARGQLRFLQVSWPVKDAEVPKLSRQRPTEGREEILAGVSVRVLDARSPEVEEWLAELKKQGAKLKWIPDPPSASPERQPVTEAPPATKQTAKREALEDEASPPIGDWIIVVENVESGANDQ